MNKADELITKATDALLGAEVPGAMSHQTALAVLGLLLTNDGRKLDAINAAYAAVAEAA